MFVAPKRILIVEDDDVARAALAEMLHEDGYIVEIASDGLSALLKLTAFAPDLVLTDYNMPGLDGLPVVVDGVTDAPEAGIGATHGEALVKALHVVVAGEGLHGADEAGQLAGIQVKERVGIGTDNAVEDNQAVFIGQASGVLVEQSGHIAVGAVAQQ